MINIIAAVAQNGVIGKDGKIPWHLPHDMTHFKNLTMGHSVVMGRRTWESLPGPLRGRQNIVVTSAKGLDVTMARSLKVALAIASNEVFVIGGEQLYREALPLADRLYLTHIHRDYDGDTFFPVFNPFHYFVESHEAFCLDHIPHTFRTYTKIANK